MKTVLNIIKRPAELTTHLTICLSLWFLTICIVDRFNAAMNFLGTNLTEYFVLAGAFIFVYQTAVCVFSYAKMRKALPCLAISLICALISVYLIYVCMYHLGAGGRHALLKELNKDALLIYSLLSTFSSVFAIAVQRTSKRAFNRQAKVHESTDEN